MGDPQPTIEPPNTTKPMDTSAEPNPQPPTAEAPKSMDTTSDTASGPAGTTSEAAGTTSGPAGTTSGPAGTTSGPAGTTSGPAASEAARPAENGKEKAGEKKEEKGEEKAGEKGEEKGGETGEEKGGEKGGVVLRRGGVRELFEKGSMKDGTSAALQVVNISVMAPSAGPGIPARHRVYLSDGTHFIECMLSTPLNERVAKGEIQNLSIVSLKKSEVRQVTSDRKILIAKEIDVITKPMDKIGSPSDIVEPQKLQKKEADKRRAPDTSSLSGQSSEKKATSRRLTAILDLNVHLSRWAIRARITKKEKIRTWTNARGEGRLFSVELLDVGGGQIRATIFNKQVDKFFEDLEVGAVYEICNGQIKTIDRSKPWNKGSLHQCEISFTGETEVQRVPDDPTIQNERYDFVKIRDIANMEAKDVVDLLAIVMECSPLGEIVSKKGKPVQRRTLVVRDDTDMSIEITLWGASAVANEFDTSDFSKMKIVAFKGLEVSSFGGKSLSLSYGGSINIAPERKEAVNLKQWWDTVADQKRPPDALTSSKKAGPMEEIRVTVDDIDTQKLGYGDKPDYITLRAIVAKFFWSVDRLPWYKACQKEIVGAEGKKRACAKKVEESDDTNSQYTCVACGPVHDYKHRYMLNCLVADATGSTIITAFDEVATQLLGGKTADELAAHLDKNEKEQLTNIFTIESAFKYWVLKCRVKTEETRGSGNPIQRTHIMTAKPIDFNNETKLLNDALRIK